MVYFVIQLALFAAIYGATCYGIMNVFEKADRTIPNWAAFVPFYNLYLLGTRVAGKAPVWCLVVLIPVAGMILMSLEVAKKFGKDVPFAVGMGLVPFVFYPMLGMSDARDEVGRKAKARLAA
jgi:hypothetical protein